MQDVKLSAEVEPFIPQKKGLEGSLVSMSLSGEPSGGGGGGGAGGGGVETTPIPSYLITCYPFVQENQPNRYGVGGVDGGLCSDNFSTFFFPHACIHTDNMEARVGGAQMVSP